ncbi:hypothetical protein EV421DRAFT_1737176 [Armillaria borealis]|uniref:Uncharacterized protein n=1 Tax=Armillaria borealis TaxID=47425 RepID=A0AA39MP18_9AGAR|nr:hypothetical protein EV421DRAFT_1737176 [Armillaria borealis]
MPGLNPLGQGMLWQSSSFVALKALSAQASSGRIKRHSLGFYINFVFRKFSWKYLTIKPDVFISGDGTLSFGSVMFLVPVNSCLNQIIVSPLSKSFHYGHSDPLINPYLRGGCDIWTDEDVVDATFGFTLEEVRELERHLKVHSVGYLTALITLEKYYGAVLNEGQGVESELEARSFFVLGLDKVYIFDE